MIKSDTFGGVTLSGDDARKFDRQVRYGRPSLAAQETLKQGDALLARFASSRGTRPEDASSGWTESTKVRAKK
jgi:hypothetical protein